MGSLVGYGEPHQPHQTFHTLPVHLMPLPLQPGRHTPGAIEGRLQVLTVYESHELQVVFVHALGTIVQGGPAKAQQGALAHQG